MCGTSRLVHVCTVQQQNNMNSLIVSSNAKLNEKEKLFVFTYGIDLKSIPHANISVGQLIKMAQVFVKRMTTANKTTSFQSMLMRNCMRSFPRDAFKINLNEITFSRFSFRNHTNPCVYNISFNRSHSVYWVWVVQLFIKENQIQWKTLT